MYISSDCKSVSDIKSNSYLVSYPSLAWRKFSSYGLHLKKNRQLFLCLFSSFQLRNFEATMKRTVGQRDRIQTMLASLIQLHKLEMIDNSQMAALKNQFEKLSYQQHPVRIGASLNKDL